MGKSQRDKGKRGEREAAKVLTKALGVKFARGVQHSGSPDSPDVKAAEPLGLHFEIKRDESTIANRVHEKLKKSRHPVIIHHDKYECSLAAIAVDMLDECDWNMPMLKGTMSLWKAMAQAIDDAGDGKIPVVMSRRNGGKWYLFVRLIDYGPFVEKVKEIKCSNN